MRISPDTPLEWIRALDADQINLLLGSLEKFLSTDRLGDYRAYPKQLEFHALGGQYPSIKNRLLQAQNRGGKTLACGAETAYHLTGEYPRWWPGYRFTHPITAWVASATGEATRDNAQRMLLGMPKQEGTGWIPKRCLTGMYARSGQVRDLYDYLYIRHVSGGLSLLKFRFYAQDVKTWMGVPVDLMWFDEEPPEKHYYEGLARTIDTKGISLMSYTPKQGSTPIVNLYMKDPKPETSQRAMVQMNIRDAQHLTREEQDAEIARWPKHQQRAVIWGLPAMGEGQIYPYAKEEITCPPVIIPDYFPVLGAIDIAGSSTSERAHPTAAVKLALDPDNDIVYVMREYREKGLRPAEHWLTLKHFGKGLKWAWPRDASKQTEETGTGEAIIDLYREEGMLALPFHAQWPTSNRKTRAGTSSGRSAGLSNSLSVHRGLLECNDRFQTGRLKIFDTCPKLWDEIESYHQKDHSVVKEADDLCDAMRYGIMMLRFAAPLMKRRPLNLETPDGALGL